MTRMTASEFQKLQKKAKKPRKDGEHEEQAKFIAWCRANEKAHECLAWVHAIPNGGLRKRSIALKLKREGVLSGVADIFLPFPSFGDFGYGFCGLWIEFKYVKNVLSKNQRLFLEEMKNRGYAVAVVYSAKEAIEKVKKYLGIK